MYILGGSLTEHGRVIQWSLCSNCGGGDGRAGGVNSKLCSTTLLSVERDSDCDGTLGYLRGDLPGQVPAGHIPLQERQQAGGGGGESQDFMLTERHQQAGI